MKILLSGFCLLSFLSLSAQDSLTILFAGDAMMHQKQLDNTRRGDFFDMGSYFANIEREVKAADIAVVNCCTQTVQTVMFCQRVSYFFL